MDKYEILSSRSWDMGIWGPCMVKYSPFISGTAAPRRTTKCILGDVWPQIITNIITISIS